MRETGATRVVGLLAVVALLAALWVFPAVFFASPGANDAAILWSAPLPLVGLTLVASLVAVVVERVKGRPPAASVALGMFFLGVAVAFLIGMLTVADLSDDRFWPFLLSPVAFAAAGTVLLLTALLGRRIARSEAVRGLVIGAAAAVFLLVWMLARGSRDWLLAPYGFDIWLLIALEAAVVFLSGGRPLSRPRALRQS